MRQVRQGNSTDRAALEALWDYSFEARTTPFFRFYFDTCYRAEETLVAETEAGVAAALHLRPYTLTVRGAQVDVTYIVGLTSHPAARGRGHAKALLAAALTEGCRQGRYANILMPSSMALYRPYGWALWCHLWRREAQLSDISAPAPDGIRLVWLDESADMDALAAVYAAYTAARSGYARRTPSDWQRWLRGQLAEGHVILATDGRVPIGYWAYTLTDRTLTVGEQASIDPRGQAAMMHWLARHTAEAERAVWYAPMDDAAYFGWADGAERTYITNRTLPWMAIRIADVARWWEQLPAAADGTLVVAVADPWQRETTHWAVRAAAGERPHVEATTRAADIHVGIGALGTLLMGGLDAAGLARAGMLTGNPAAVERLRRMYPACSVYNMEWY